MFRNSKTLYALTTCLIPPLHLFSTSAHNLSLSHRSAASISTFITPKSISRSTKRNQQPQRNMSTPSSSSTEETPSAIDIATNISEVQDRIAQTILENNRPEKSVRLVAVSKTKPISLLLNAYDSGQRYFGENYAQELMSKAEEMPADIKWHFIGPLQSNKAAPLVKSLGLTKLACVETVHTMKLANKLNNAVNSLKEQEGGEDDDSKDSDKLGIYIQVNTSGEESKSGVTVGKECEDLVKEILDSCPHLRVDGLMTIGAPGDFSCFDSLAECRKDAAEVLGVDVDSLELSMGMSGDYTEAIKRGATSVRVGSTIFGARDYSKKK